MFKGTITRQLLIILVVASMVNMVGCGDFATSSGDPHIHQPDDDATDKVGAIFELSRAGLYTDVVHKSLIDNTDDKLQVLEHVSSESNIQSAQQWLASQGYTWVPANSIVLIESEYKIAPNVDARTPELSNSKSVPEDELHTLLVRSDTVVWLAFENPTQDLANHSAIISYWRNDGEPVDVFVELDISDDPIQVIREGLIVGGEFVPSDIGTDGWLGCMLSGAFVTVTTCLMSNCAYGACVGARALITLTACTIMWAASL